MKIIFSLCSHILWYQDFTKGIVNSSMTCFTFFLLTLFITSAPSRMTDHSRPWGPEEDEFDRGSSYRCSTGRSSVTIPSYNGKSFIFVSHHFIGYSGFLILWLINIVAFCMWVTQYLGTTSQLRLLIHLLWHVILFKLASTITKLRHKVIKCLIKKDVPAKSLREW